MGVNGSSGWQALSGVSGQRNIGEGLPELSHTASALVPFVFKTDSLCGEVRGGGRDRVSIQQWV